jgi:hypothetical protein
VVVRLFRLRAKVAETRSKKTKRRLSTQPGTASDDGYEASSDTDSDSTHDGSPQLAAGSDTASLIQWGEEMQEWSFSVDVGWIIGKLSLWASGMDANMCSEMFYSDPGWILDFVSLYIMHRFMSSPRFTRKF